MNTVKKSKLFQENSIEGYRPQNLQIVEDNAKHDLFQFENRQNFKIRSYRTKPNNILHGWTEQFQYYTKKYKQLCLTQNQNKTLNNSRVKNKSIKTEGTTQNLIPELKQLLIKLESPEKQKSPSNVQLFTLEVLKEIKQKRKASVKVSLIMKNSENNANHDRKRKQRLDSVEPLENISNKVKNNLTLISNTREIYNYSKEVKAMQKSELQKVKQNVIRLIKKKRLQMKIKKNQKQLKQIPMKKQNLNYLQYKRYEKPSLNNLIRL